MGWSYDSNSPQRDTSVPVEVEFERETSNKPIPWRYKFVRLWRFLTRR